MSQSSGGILLMITRQKSVRGYSCAWDTGMYLMECGKTLVCV